jgi:hypothetical protein
LGNSPAGQAIGISAESGAVLKNGKRLDVEEGKRLVVLGKLRAIDPRADTVAELVVPGWVETRHDIPIARQLRFQR